MKTTTFFKLIAMLLTLPFVFSSCSEREDIGPYQAGNRTFNLSGFDKLQMGDAFRIQVRQGGEFSLRATGDRRNLDDLDVYVSNGQLVARYRRPRGNRQYETEFEIVMPTLTAADFSAASRSTITGFSSEELVVTLSGASRANVDARADRGQINLSGASKMTLSGNFKRLIAGASGASELQAFDAPADEADANASGASELRITATNRLSATASGASNIRYRGNPVRLQMNATGASSIRKE